jgi:carbonic anhydrase
MGHDACGAIRGACQDAKLGNLTQLLTKIQPAIKQATQTFGKKDCSDEKFIDMAAADNVRNVVKMIPEQSPVIRELVKEGKVKIVGAMYRLSTGEVIFFNN